MYVWHINYVSVESGCKMRQRSGYLCYPLSYADLQVTYCDQLVIRRILHCTEISSLVRLTAGLLHINWNFFMYQLLIHIFLSVKCQEVTVRQKPSFLKVVFRRPKTGAICTSFGALWIFSEFQSSNYFEISFNVPTRCTKATLHLLPLEKQPLASSFAFYLLSRSIRNYPKNWSCFSLTTHLCSEASRKFFIFLHIVNSNQKNTIFLVLNPSNEKKTIYDFY